MDNKDIQYSNCLYKCPLKNVRNIFIPETLLKDKGNKLLYGGRCQG